MTVSESITDEQFETDIQGLILSGEYQSEWQNRYRPNTLRCRGRSRWDMKKDIFVEVSGGGLRSFVIMLNHIVLTFISIQTYKKQCDAKLEREYIPIFPQ